MSIPENTQKTISLDDVIFPNWQMFVYLAIVNFLVALIAYEYIFTEEFYRAIYEDQLELARIDKYVDIIHRYSFWSMLALPATILLKFTVVTSVLQIPLLLKFIELKFKYLFRLVMLASVPILIGQVLQFLIIYLTPLSQLSVENFKINPFSINALISSSNLPYTINYLLNQFNIFEIFWIIIITNGLKKSKLISKSDAALFTILVWLIIIFLQWLFIYFFANMQ